MHKLSRAIVLLISATLLSPLASAALAFQTPKTEIVFTAEGLSREALPSIGENKLVYRRCANNSCVIEGRDLLAKQNFTLQGGASGATLLNQSQPHTDGTTVVWRDLRGGQDNPTCLTSGYDIYGARLSDKKEFVISKAQGHQSAPRVAGNIVVWSDFRGARDCDDREAGNIYMYDIAAGTETQITTARSAQLRPATNGKVIVWQDYRNEPNAEGFNSDIYGYDIGTKQEFVISNAPDQQSDPAIWGNIVVWSDFRKGEEYNVDLYGYDLYGYDLSTKREFLISSAAGSQANPEIWGNLVVWEDYRNEPDPARGTNSDIFGYDLARKQEFPIFVGPGAQTAASVGGNFVAWMSASGDTSTVSVAQVSGVAPPLTAPIAPPIPLPGSGSRLFSETGKAVGGIFLEYWLKNGGLPQQGYPISDVIGEVSDLNSKPYTVQYFERAVFEFHPENAPPYNVLLSQLGTFQYRKKYPNGAPNQKADPGGRLFPETGKTVGGRFLEYWQQNGGLAQQGYPISEPFTEQSDLDGKLYLVQYFERAVFETHPENAKPYDVLLSQLGTFQYRAKYGR